MAELGDELTSRPGPDGLDYLDLAEGPRGSRRGGSADAGPRLLPEYDALLLAYDPHARDRFGDANAIAYTWNRANGVHSPTVLADGRLRGRWRLERFGDAGRVVVEMFPGERLMDAGELSEAVAAVGAVLDVEITDVRVARLL